MKTSLKILYAHFLDFPTFIRASFLRVGKGPYVLSNNYLALPCICVPKSQHPVNISTGTTTLDVEIYNTNWIPQNPLHVPEERITNTNKCRTTYTARKSKTKFGSLLQAGSHIAQFSSLTKSVITDIPKTAFATVTFQYQVKLILLRFVWIPPHVYQYNAS
jgi:hypothetical protein